MFSVRDASVSYSGGAIRALRNVSFDVPAAGVVAVLGSNGAGKTTLLRALSGNLPSFGGHLDSGRIEFDGTSLVGRSPAAIVRRGVVQVPEGRRIFGRLTVEENIRIGGFTRRDRAAKAATRARVLDLFPALTSKLHQKAGLLSGGEQQMLAIARGLMATPKVLLLDEPSLGLAPLVVDRIGEVIHEINGQGTTVLLVEQNAAMALRVATHGIVLTVGEVTLAGPAEAVAADTELQELYLGGNHDGRAEVAAAPLAARRPPARWQP
ncbi:MAG TPA: ABC transporter ATP-binding protein [Acidimicrobiales bacterium]|jgi:branched-chain amino acid transport system ATP-binding protein|nr:ABC transporter ATP-binding protein [Acidimicrobiales bacterium]